MASIILSAAGGALGGATGIPGGAIIGRALGNLAGSYIDNSLFGADTQISRTGPRLADLAVQTSTYGKMIPIVYGSVRLAGNMIWSTPIRETVTTTSSSSSTGGGKGGGGKVTQTSTTYSYSVSLAIAVCEGPINAVWRVWADAKLLDLSQYTMRVYLGDEAQTPDSFMAGIDGGPATPAYRGLAYVVIENFPLADYGNRIPNFTFEVQKKAQYPDYDGQIVENMIDGMVLIPGAGEFVYDTLVEYKTPGVSTGGGFAATGAQEAVNMQNVSGEANVLLALDQLADTCPNVQWVSVAACWFGNSLDAGSCTIVPGVEYQSGGSTAPNAWGVAGYTRDTAHQITLIEGSPRYGGTPDDASLLRLLAELRRRGYKVALYPLLVMDMDGKPWRGLLTGSAANVANFFTKTNGYNRFINHYASIAAGAVDAFIIGSELKGLTAVTDTPGSYPAVTQLVSLAAAVKSALGGGVIVTYGADWSEYHHTDGGWYQLDPLWASPNIDVVGIDAYFPLADAPQDATYAVQPLIDGWTSGEGYDFYFTDGSRTVTAPLAAPYAWKNIAWWWSNAHVNPNGVSTAWVPQSKKIWFTEYGFPSVDGSANQPNVFYDSASALSAFPYFSRGRVDFRAQRAGITATEAAWQGSAMIERKFLWTWDARPYPYFPDLTAVWGDGPNWQYGHWTEGKLGVSSLAAIVADLCARAGLQPADYDVSAITDQVEGFAVGAQQSIRASIQQLEQGYFFDTCESDGVLKFIPRGGTPALSITDDMLVPQAQNGASRLLSITRAQELELPQRVNVVYMSRLSNYQPATQYSARAVTRSRQAATVSLPLVFADQVAKTVADTTLFTLWVSRVAYAFRLPMRYAALDCADVIDVTAEGVTHRMRVTSVTLAAPGMLHVEAVAEDISAYDFYTPPGQGENGTGSITPLAATLLDMLDMPALPGDAAAALTLRYAAAGSTANWPGAALYRSDDGGGSFQPVLDITTQAAMGTAVTALGSGPYCVFDETSAVTVALAHGQLQSIPRLSVLNGGNAALLGNELLQFTTATLLSAGQYRLSGLLRGRQGTEWAIGTHAAGERFVLLDGSLAQQAVPPHLLNLPRFYKPVTFGGTLDGTQALGNTYTGICAKPYAPSQVQGARDGSGNLTISWVRRTRVSGEWQDYVDVPLNEGAEAYEVDILQSGAVVRTLSGLSAPSAGYTAAQQASDFGGTQSSVSVRVYQLSAVVGRGYGASAVV
ncbi:MAG: glycoside hydrolase TIM-barrel-like domain-containing protein [Alphaproteobacteria bacterium]|nr:glycoside hydrolase TIM-barrel-like domain-containing protein [Alphaproteobacteria bacterium]